MKIKYFLLFLTTLSISAILGFLFGAFPDTIRSVRGYTPEQILVLSSSDVFPAEVLEEYQKKTGKAVVVKIIESYHLFKTEAQRADLLFAPLSWNQGILDFLSDSLKDPNLESLLSTDFKSIQINLSTFMPALWQINKDKDNNETLQVWGFSVPIESSGNPIDFIRFISSDKKRILKWSEKVNQSFSLKITDTMDSIAPEKRASAIRLHPLSQLKIEVIPP